MTIDVVRLTNAPGATSFSDTTPSTGAVTFVCDSASIALASADLCLREVALRLLDVVVRIRILSSMQVGLGLDHRLTLLLDVVAGCRAFCALVSACCAWSTVACWARMPCVGIWRLGEGQRLLSLFDPAWPG